MSSHQHRTVIGLLLGILAAPLVADDAPKQVAQHAGFLEDYTILHKGPEGHLYYKSKDFNERIKSYDAVMVDMPQIFISPYSEYRGLKVRQLDVMATTFREALQKSLSETFIITDKPGPKVMLVRMAAVDMLLKKERFHILSYTPVGLVLTGGKYVFEPELNRALRHIDLRDVKIEGELRDSQTGELLGEFIGLTREAKHPETWQHLVRKIDHWAEDFNLRMEVLKGLPARPAP